MMLYRGAFAVVDLTSIQSNIRNIRALLQPGTRLMVAVKANGYGHGATQVAHAVLSAGADALAVASLEEAIELREAGVNVSILVLGSVPWVAARVAQARRIDLTVSTDWAPILAEAVGCVGGLGRVLGLSKNDPPLGLHLKLDTGMSRLGFREMAEVTACGECIAKSESVRFAGLFTHLASADDPSSSTAETQLHTLSGLVSSLASVGLRPEVVHAANSAGIFRSTAFHLDMVRVGISAYGYPPSADVPPPVPLQPALSLYAFVTRVAHIPTGQPVGYGGTFVAPRSTRVATLPIGYADGYPRWLSNRGHVILHGQAAPVIGRVCMDQLMVDVTDIPSVQIGDCACLYGRYAPSEWTASRLWDAIEAGAGASGGSGAPRLVHFLDSYRQAAATAPVLSLDEVAQIGHTISYELMCALSPRIPRLYVE